MVEDHPNISFVPECAFEHIDKGHKSRFMFICRMFWVIRGVEILHIGRTLVLVADHKSPDCGEVSPTPHFKVHFRHIHNRKGGYGFFDQLVVQKRKGFSKQVFFVVKIPIDIGFVNGSCQTDLFGMFGAAGAIPEPELQPAPAEIPHKDLLLWERDLMGLYISAHPLDKYDLFFEEQTYPYEFVKAENDNKTITIGGIINSVRTILTKKGEKMAFVKIENKTAEQEIIVFPKTYQSIGGKLVEDNVIKVTGRINAKDQNGNISSEVKVIAESIEVISDDILDSYHSTGEKLPPLGEAAKPKARRRTRTSAARVATPETPRAPATPPSDPRKQKLYILIKDPTNTELLSSIRHTCDLNPGVQDIIMVLDDGKTKSPIRPQFKVEICDGLTSSLSKLLGKDCVVIK